MQFDIDTSTSTGTGTSSLAQVVMVTPTLDTTRHVCECLCKATKLCPKHHVRIFQNQRLSSWRQRQRLSKCLARDGQEQQLACVDLSSFNSIQILLNQSSRWDFNIFSFNRCTANRSLFYLGWHLFNHYKLVDEFHLDSMQLCHTLYLIEQMYHSCNSYHNDLHAADVAQAMHCFIQDDVLAASLSKLDIMACIVAALCHDLDHPGRTAAFLTASQHLLSTLYAQQGSILERHHWFTTRSLLHETGLFAHESMTRHVGQLYDMIEDMILATDMSQHATFMLQLRQHQVKKQLSSALTSSSEMQLQLRLDTSEEEKRLALRLTLKCADICNPARDWAQCRTWAQLIVDEFFEQGDAEQLVGRPCSPLMNRRSDKLAKIQIGFIKFVVNPLFSLWNSWLQSNLSQRVFCHVVENLTLWEAWDQLVVVVNEAPDHVSLDKISKEYLQRLRALNVTTAAAVNSSMELSPLCEEVSVVALADGGSSKTAILVDDNITNCATQGRRHSLPVASLMSNACGSRRRGSCQVHSTSSSTALARMANRQHTAALIARCQQKDKKIQLNKSCCEEQDAPDNYDNDDWDNENSSSNDSRKSFSDDSTKEFVIPPTLTQLNRRRGSAPTPSPLSNWSESLVRVVVQQHQFKQQQQQQRQRSSSVDLVFADVNTRNFLSSFGMLVSLQSCVSQAGSIHSNTGSREAALNEV